MRVVIFAGNVHKGGGAILLRGLLESSVLRENCIAFLDRRERALLDSSGVTQWSLVNATVSSRIAAELSLWRLVKRGDLVLCIGNLPPLLKNSGRVVLFLQNRFLVDSRFDSLISLRDRLKLSIERRWLKWRCRHVDEVYVQSESMSRAVMDQVPTLAGRRIHVSPFIDLEAFRRGAPVKVFDYIYPAAGYPYKNHKRLVDAWVELSRHGHFPSLILTVDRENHRELCSYIDCKRREFALKITNLGPISRDELARRMSESRALIYPSLVESMGLPLLEAESLGLQILGSELDYVRDSVSPDQTFDPMSAVSIARAVARNEGLVLDRADPISTRDWVTALTKMFELDGGSDV